MPLNSTNVELTYENIVAGVPIAVDIPTFEKSSVYVKYGALGWYAVQGYDYTVELSYPAPQPPPTTQYFQSITVTPTQALLDKIALQGPNTIKIGRSLPLTTDFAEIDAFTRSKIDVEFARTNMKLQQLELLESTSDVPDPRLGTPGDGIRVNGANSGYEFVPFPIVVDGSSSAYTGVENVRAHGAIGDGIADDTAAFFQARAAAIANGTVFHMPPGIYNLATVSQPFLLWDNAKICGAGMYKTTIRWNDRGTVEFLFRHETTPRISNVELCDFKIEGTKVSNPSFDNWNYPIVIRGVDRIRVHGVWSYGSRVMGMAFRECDNVYITGCHVSYVASDGISCAGCSNVRIFGNQIDHGDDDGISFHTQAGAVPPINTGVIVANNRLFMCQGIKGAGGNSVVVSGNVLDFTFGLGISLSTSAAGGTIEGQNAETSVIIANNTIRNHMNRTYIDNLSTSGSCIAIFDFAPRAGTLGAIPGNATGGAVIYPNPYMLNNSNAATMPIPKTNGILIADNVMETTVSPSAHLSDYGFGQLFTRNGFVDPPAVEGLIRCQGVYLQGYGTGTTIRGNQFKGIHNALTLGFDAEVEGLRFTHNRVYDMKQGGIVVNGGNTSKTIKYVEDNIFDLDPYCASAYRGANGTWTVGNALMALYLQNAKGWSIARNTFRNCSQAADIPQAGGTVGFEDYSSEQYDNIVEQWPVVLNFSTSNRGVGVVYGGNSGFRTRIVDFDPASATFRQVLNDCLVAATVMPTTGRWVAGHFLRNYLPASVDGNNMITLGWVRVTTGSGNVAGTDWRTVYASAVSPAA